MKAKLAGTTGMPFEVREVSCHTYEEFTGKEAIPFIQYYADEEGNFYKDTDLDFNLDHPHPEATISGWVARTQDGLLGLLRIKPERSGGDWWIDLSPYERGIYRLPSELFPDITWDSDPIEVEITIKPKKAMI